MKGEDVSGDQLSLLRLLVLDKMKVLAEMFPHENAEFMFGNETRIEQFRSVSEINQEHRITIVKQYTAFSLSVDSIGITRGNYARKNPSDFEPDAEWSATDCLIFLSIYDTVKARVEKMALGIKQFLE